MVVIENISYMLTMRLKLKSSKFLIFSCFFISSQICIVHTNKITVIQSFPKSSVILGKSGAEAEMAYFTQKFFFIHKRDVLGERMLEFLKKYVEMQQGNEVSLSTYWTKANRNVSSSRYKYRSSFCYSYLLDKTLQENGIYYDPDPSRIDEIELLITFDYYTRIQRKHLVLQCPVKVKQQSSHLFFMRFKKDSTPADTSYFVLASTSPFEIASLYVLMYTTQEVTIKQEKKPENVPLSSIREEQVLDEHLGLINFRRMMKVPKERTSSEIVLFGKAAERVFITSTSFYFINLDLSDWFVDKFIQLMEKMRKGSLSIFSRGKSKTKDVKTKEEIPVKHRRLEMPAEVNHAGKKQKEAFMALVTYPLGFMNTDTQQAPFIEKFLIEYQKYKYGYEVSNTNIAKIFKSSDPWCRVLLQEPVLQDNKIMWVGSKPERLTKVVHFEYFSKEDEEHDVIQCTVFIRKRKVEIYFSTMGKSHFENLKFYFVLTAYKPNDNSKLVVLMRTKFHVNETKEEDENDYYNEYMYDFSQVGQIRLNIKPNRFKDGYRLVGKFAEAAFISTNYGFWNPTINPKILHRFIDMALTLSKGYEIQLRRMKSRAVLQEGPLTCESHINTSRLFKTYKIKYDDSKVGEIITTKQTISSFIREIPNQRLRFLRCPVTNGSENGFILHHPIYFKGSAEFSRYDLFWYIASDGDYQGEEVLLFLAPNKEKKGEKDSDDPVSLGSRMVQLI